MQGRQGGIPTRACTITVQQVRDERSIHSQRQQFLSASRPNIPAGGNSKIEGKEPRMAGQQLSTRAASFASELKEPETSDLARTSAKLTRQRSSREARRSSKEADSECPFEKINREGGLSQLPCVDPGDAKSF